LLTDRLRLQVGAGFIGYGAAMTYRLKSAHTRARQKLVVGGDSATLGEHPFYRDFLDYVECIGAYRSAWEFVEG
jgi:ATP-dependent RNA/DNA helicase IGHMBP2